MGLRFIVYHKMAKLIVVLCLFISAVSSVELPNEVYDVKDDMDYYWRDFNGTVPIDALATGHGVYVAQLVYEDYYTILPGTLYPDQRIAVSIANGQKFVQDKNIKILYTREPQRFIWKYVNTKDVQGDFLQNCPLGGYELYVGSNLYIGKIYHENEWKIAPVVPAGYSYQGLNVWYNTRYGHIAHDFYVLKYE